MTQIPIVSGIYADTSPDFRTSYPVNMVPVPKSTGLASGYLRMVDGIVEQATGPGVSRGGILWNGVEYRVMGTKLVSVSGSTVTTIGDVGGTGDVSMVYSFDFLAIASGGNLYLYNGTTLAQVTDADLGTALDVIWIDGYFMTTDGENLVVTELNNPFEINPLKYGSSEVDPDPVVGLKTLRNEVYAINRHTIEVFRNVGGDLFPFQRIDGAQIDRGAVGTHCAVVFMERLAFIGSGRNEAVSVCLGSNGQDIKISTREVDLILSGYSEAQLATAYMEVRGDLGSETLIIHLPDLTMCYDGPASAVLERPVWYYLQTDVLGGKWDARHLVWNDGWSVGSLTQSKVGRLSREVFTHWGEKTVWEFGTPIVYNGGSGAIVHELELVSLTGSAPFGENPIVTTEYSADGVTWSLPRNVRAGERGERSQRIKWTRQGTIRNFRMQRFKGDTDSPLSVARLEAKMEPLAW